MYQAQISRQQPSAFVFLIDQSGSMEEKGAHAQPLCDRVAESINGILHDLIIKCSKSDGVRDYFDIAVIGYSNNQVYNGFGGAMSQAFFHPISQIADHPLRLEKTEKQIVGPRGDSGVHVIQTPVWFDPRAVGNTPMNRAYQQAADLLVDWCDTHRDCFPPMLINITDGEATDGDPEEIAHAIQDISTTDGAVLVYNLHLSIKSVQEFLYCDKESGLPDDLSRKLFRMSSLLSPAMEELARHDGYPVSPRSRGYAYNADISSLVSFLDIGTRAATLR